MKFRLLCAVVILVISFGAPTAAQVASPLGPLTNADVMQLAGRGLSEEVMLGAIRGAGRIAFDLSADGLVKLKSAGVSDRVILEMQNQSKANSTAGLIVRAAESQIPTLSATEWQQRYDEASSRRRGAKKWMTISALFAAAAVPVYMTSKAWCTDPDRNPYLTPCEPVMGMSSPTFTAVAWGTLGGLATGIEALKLGNANADLRHLEAMRPRTGGLSVGVSEHHGMHVNLERGASLAYRLRW